MDRKADAARQKSHGTVCKNPCKIRVKRGAHGWSSPHACKSETRCNCRETWGSIGVRYQEMLSLGSGECEVCAPIHNALFLRATEVFFGARRVELPSALAMRQVRIAINAAILGVSHRIHAHTGTLADLHSSVHRLREAHRAVAGGARGGRTRCRLARDGAGHGAGVAQGSGVLCCASQ